MYKSYIYLSTKTNTSLHHFICVYLRTNKIKHKRSAERLNTFHYIFIFDWAKNTFSRHGRERSSSNLRVHDVDRSASALRDRTSSYKPICAKFLKIIWIYTFFVRPFRQLFMHPAMLLIRVGEGKNRTSNDALHRRLYHRKSFQLWGANLNVPRNQLAV